MAAATTANRAEAPMPRWSLALAGVVHSGALAWAGITLPWQPTTPLAMAAVGLAGCHAATALSAVFRARIAARAWRGTALASLLFFAVCSWQLLTAASYIATLYDGLGRGIASVIAIALAPIALFTLPFAFWGLAATGRKGSNHRVVAAAALAAALAVFGVWRAALAARPQVLPAPAPTQTALIEGIAAALPQRSPPQPARRTAALDSRAPARCDRPPGADRREATAVLRYRAGDAAQETRVECLQGEASALAARIGALLLGATAGSPAKIDWIVGVRPLSRGPAAVDRLQLRPGLDGICLDGRCLMPWQLVLADQFNAVTPLSAAPDFRFGVDASALRRALGGGAEGGFAGLRAIEVVSLVVGRDGELARLRRLRPRATGVEPAALAAAARRVERHVVEAQRDDGAYRYRIDPASGDSLGGRFSLARQAGTTLVLCELAENRDRAAVVARRSLAQLAQRERGSGDRGGLVGSPRRTQARLGRTALPLVAFLSCRGLVGSDFDPLIGRLGRLLLASQRPDGSFYPRFDLETGAGVPGGTPLYAEGQAVLALTLLERELAGQPGQPSREAVRDAVERAMDRVAGAYWSHPLRDFFFIEENWHCLAARASLPHHRHDGYERFCLDYSVFRSRLLLDADGGASDFAGGVGFGNLFPPHSVPTAGLGEILAAAVAIKRARGEDPTAERRQLQQVLGFLLRQQWRESGCFACARPRRVLGGFSESAASPVLRIDYAQHAWAAIGHGSRALLAPGAAADRLRPARGNPERSLFTSFSEKSLGGWQAKPRDRLQRLVEYGTSPWTRRQPDPARSAGHAEG